MTTHKKILGALAVVVGLAATTAAQEAPGTEEVPNPECPDFIRGAKLTVTNVDQGVQFKLLAGQPVHVESLRAMTRELAEFVEAHEPSTTTMPEDPAAATQTLPIPPIEIVVKDVAGGALVTVKAENRTDVNELRLQAESVQELWRSSQCINGPHAAIYPTL